MFINATYTNAESEIFFVYAYAAARIKHCAVLCMYRSVWAGDFDQAKLTLWFRLPLLGAPIRFRYEHCDVLLDVINPDAPFD